VRAVSIAKLRLRHDMTLWDIGAGSGSVSIEADQLLPNGEIYAIERNPQCLAFLKENLGKFKSRHINVVAGEAPDCFDQLPDPERGVHRRFGGETSGRFSRPLTAACRPPAGCDPMPSPSIP